jgi:hypothetical protein
MSDRGYMGRLANVGTLRAAADNALLDEGRQQLGATLWGRLLTWQAVSWGDIRGESGRDILRQHQQSAARQASGDLRRLMLTPIFALGGNAELRQFLKDHPQLRGNPGATPKKRRSMVEAQLSWMREMQAKVGSATHPGLAADYAKYNKGMFGPGETNWPLENRDAYERLLKLSTFTEEEVRRLEPMAATTGASFGDRDDLCAFGAVLSKEAPETLKKMKWSGAVVALHLLADATNVKVGDPAVEQAWINFAVNSPHYATVLDLFQSVMGSTIEVDGICNDVAACARGERHIYSGFNELMSNARAVSGAAEQADRRYDKEAIAVINQAAGDILGDVPAGGADAALRAIPCPFRKPQCGRTRSSLTRSRPAQMRGACGKGSQGRHRRLGRPSTSMPTSF